MGDRVVGLEGEPPIGIGGDAGELVVHGHENLPRLLTAGVGESLHDQLFEFGHAFALPDLVGKADQHIVEAHAGFGPRRMGSREPGEFLTDTTLDQKPVSVLLMGRPRPGQFFRVNDLADVVGRRPEQHRLTVDLHPAVVRCDSVDQLAGHIMDRPQVRSKPGRSAQTLQQDLDPLRQRPKSQPAAISQGSPKHYRGHGNNSNARTDGPTVHTNPTGENPPLSRTTQKWTPN